MSALVGQLREIVATESSTHAELETLWAAVRAAARRKHSLCRLDE